MREQLSGRNGQTPRWLAKLGNAQDTPDNYCPECDGKGFVEVEFRAIRLDTGWIPVPVNYRRVCSLCEKGIEALAAWQAGECEHCKFGVIAPSPAEIDRESLRDYEVMDTLAGGACPVCAEGWRIAEEIKQFLARREQAKLEKLVEGSELTEYLRGCTFDNFNPYSPVLANAKRVIAQAAQEKQSLFVYGKSGIGKSHLSAAYLNYLLMQGLPGLFTTLPELMGSLRATIGNLESDSWEERLQKYINAQVLVIDDLGQGKQTAKTIEVLFLLLNSRVNRNLPTVVSSNYNLEELSNKLLTAPDVDEYNVTAIISRLRRLRVITWAAGDFRAMQGD